MFSISLNGWYLNSKEAQSARLFSYSWRENSCIHTFPGSISAMWNANDTWMRISNPSGKTWLWRWIFVAASHQTRLDTRSKARRPIKVGIKGEGRSGTSRDSNPAGLCGWSAHFVQCEPDETSSFTNPNVGPGTYASLRLKLDALSSAIHGWQRRQRCCSPTRW